MGTKKVLAALAVLLISLLVLWLLESQDSSDVTDWKELYRDAFHTQAADMEARQRKLRDDQTN